MGLSFALCFKKEVLCISLSHILLKTAMAKSVTVAVIEPAEIDVHVFSLWLRGIDVQEAARSRLGQEPLVTRQLPDFRGLLEAETEDMYRQFRSLEPYLQSPPTFHNQQVFNIPYNTRTSLIELYYTFDEVVVREFLGRKLSSKNRKDLDDVSEKTGVALRSCRRQFDNIKQVLKVVDDFEGSLVENIKQQFLLPNELAHSYASLVFLSHNRFETGKKRLAHLSVGDFTACANLMIEHWTLGSIGSRHVDDDLELDRDFLQELHDVKINLVDKGWIERHQKVVVRDLKKQHYAQVLVRSVETHFKVLYRAITSLGSSLIHSKDMKDFFVDLMEKVIEPCKQQKWSQEEVEQVLTSMIEVFSDYEAAQPRQYLRPKDRTWGKTYLRYLGVLKQCINILYHD